MRYFSMFSGIGGFELGIQRAYNKLQSTQSGQTDTQERGFGDTDKRQDGVLLTDNAPLCVGYSEIDKYAIQIYQKHFGGHKNYGNAKDIEPDTIPDFDLLVGGFPCQAFSIAGQRRGFEDTRGTLFFEIARIVKRKQPRMLLLENVKGLTNHDNGRTFATILQTLDELGYDAEWQVLNSKHFGVPQNRERVFIIGHLRGTGSRQIFPIQGTDGKDNIIYGLLDTETWKKRHEQIRRIHSIEGISPTIPTGTGGGVMTKIRAVLTPDRPEKRQNGRRFKENGEPMFTLTGQDKHGIMKDSRIRRLTPIECERLQGFADGWTEGVSDTQRYKCLGNAVTVNVIETIINEIIIKYEHES